VVTVLSRRPANRRQGDFAVEVVADEYGLVVDQHSAEWYDAVHPSSGAKYEVKSTHRELASGEPGAFRLWKDQHRSLAAATARGVAWYAFVLLDENDDVDDLVRVKPSTIAKRIDDWNQAGHADREGPQKKLPWTEVPRLG
jgi:hypothetical protein